MIPHKTLADIPVTLEFEGTIGFLTADFAGNTQLIAMIAKDQIANAVKAQLLPADYDWREALGPPYDVSPSNRFLKIGDPQNWMVC